MNRKRLTQQSWFRILAMVVALEMVAIAINFFYAPIHVAAGGATGVAILLDTAFGINRSLTVLIFNVAMIILSIIFLDRKSVRNITVGSFLLPLLMYITPSYKVVNDAILAVIIGGGIFATGVALLYRLEASAGGTTVPPMILKKFFGINTAVSLLCIDLTITLFNLIVSSTNAFFLAAFSLVVTMIVMRYIETGFDLKRQVQIMSNEHLPAIHQMLLDEKLSLTIYEARGGYTNEAREMIMVMLNGNEYAHLLRKIHDIDPNAFITTTNVTEVHGGRLGY